MNRRRFIYCAASGLMVPVRASVPIPLGFFKASSGVSHQADVSDWISRVNGNGGSVSTGTATAADTQNLAVASIRSKILRWNFFAGTGFAAAQVPYIKDKGSTLDNPKVATAAGSGSDFTYVETGASGGLKPLTANAWLDTGFTPSVDWASIDDAGLSMYLMDGSIENATVMGCGLFGGGTQCRFIIRTSGANDSSVLICAPPYAFYLTDTVGTGLYTGSRTASNSLTLYRNASSVATQSAPGGALFGVPIGIWTFNLDTGPGNYSTKRSGGYVIHKGLTSGETMTLYNAIQAFQTSLTRQV